MGPKTRTKRDIPKRQPKPLGPTKPSQERNALRFALKNENRKACRLKDGYGYRAGRRTRSELALGGAFGHRDPAIYNQCVIGTTGHARSGDDRED